MVCFMMLGRKRLIIHLYCSKDLPLAGAGGADCGGVSRVLRNDEATAAEHQLHMREAPCELDGPRQFASQHDIPMTVRARMAEAQHRDDLRNHVDNREGLVLWRRIAADFAEIGGGAGGRQIPEGPARDIAD